jgi:hypothetical protein
MLIIYGKLKSLPLSDFEHGLGIKPDKFSFIIQNHHSKELIYTNKRAAGRSLKRRKLFADKKF